MNRTLKILVEAAERRGIKPSFLLDVPSDNFLRLTKGDRSVVVQKTKTPYLAAVSARMVTDKNFSGSYMKASGLPVAEKRLVESLTEADFEFLKRHKEIAVKPNASDRGLGVSLRVSSPAQLQVAFTRAAAHGQVLLEQYAEGREYRVLVINQKVAGVLEWRIAGPVGECSAPGGEVPVDRTAQANPSILDLAIRAASLFSIDVAGIDLICPDISKPPSGSNKVAILEVNPGPDFFAHLNPAEGSPQPVDDLYLDYLFP